MKQTMINKFWEEKKIDQTKDKLCALYLPEKKSKRHHFIPKKQKKKK